MTITLIILERIQSINVVTSSSGETALHKAICSTKKAATEQIYVLLKAGVNVNITRSSDGKSALHLIAFQKDSLPIMQAIVKSGAILNLLDGSGSTALHYAANAGHSNMVKYLLSRGANPNIGNVDDEQPWQLGCPVAFFEAGFYPHILKEEDKAISWRHKGKLPYLEILWLAELDFCIDHVVGTHFGKKDETINIECYRLIHAQACCHVI